MSKILVINGAISAPEKSYSTGVLNKFIEEYKILNPNDEFTFVDLNNEKMASTTITRDNFATYFNQEDSIKYIEQLKSHDKLIIVSAMNNFGPSAILKNYLDHVLLADHTFSYKYSKKGDAIGLLTNLTVQIIVAQGAPKGWYEFGNVEKYLEGVFNFTGSKINTPLVIHGTKVAPINAQTPIEAATNMIEEIKKTAASF